MTQEPSQLSKLRRPWYYQNRFLVPAFILGWPFGLPFVFWPVWALLIIRSPWHTSLYIRALAWAMLITGAILVVRLFRAGEGAEAGASAGGPGLAVVLVLPGFVLTVVTQYLWGRYRMELRSGTGPPSSPAGPGQVSLSPARRPRSRRRVHRRRSPRPGRSSRHHR